MFQASTQTAARALSPIDEHRALLLAEARLLVDAAVARRSPVLAVHVDRMAALAGALFAEEERRLREAAPPSLERHLREHRRFLADLDVFSRDLNRRSEPGLADLRVARHVVGWLEAHLGWTGRDRLG
jgi:hemerythrin